MGRPVVVWLGAIVQLLLPKGSGGPSMEASGPAWQ